MENNFAEISLNPEELDIQHKFKEFFEFMDCDGCFPGVAEKLDELSDQDWVTLLSYMEFADASFPSEILAKNMLERIADGKIVLTDDPREGSPTRHQGIHLVIYDEEPP